MSEILSEVHSTLALSRATFLHCKPLQKRTEHLVSGVTIPADRDMQDRLSSEEGFCLLSQPLALQTTTARTLDERITRNGTTIKVKAYQVALKPTNDQFILALSCERGTFHRDLSKKNSTRILDFLALFGQAFKTLEWAEYEQRRRCRRVALDEILSSNGTPREVARKVCSAWRKFLGAKAVCLWVRNTHMTTKPNLESSEEEVLDVLHLDCDSPNEHILVGLEIGLPLDLSSEGKALMQGNVLRIGDTEMNGARSGSLNADVVPQKPQPRLCIPLLLKGRQRAADSTRDGIGTLDVFVDDPRGVDQEDDRLLFLGNVTAIALDRSYTSEQRDVIKRLNDLALTLSQAHETSQNNTRTTVYLNQLRDLIKEAVGVNSLSIFEADETGKELRCVVTTGLS